MVKVRNQTPTSEEVEALRQQEERYDNAPSVDRMEAVSRLVRDQFGIDDNYHVTGFKDSGRILEATFDSQDFTLSVKVKHPKDYGLEPPDED